MDNQSLDSLEDKSQYLIDNGNPFGKDFGQKCLGLVNSGFQLSEKQVALLERLVAETQDPSLREPKETTGAHLGQVGQPLNDLRLTLAQAKPIQTKMGASVLNRFHDADGNEVVSFAEHALAEEGQSLVVSGIVSRHSEFRGTRSTTLKNVQISADALMQDAAQTYSQPDQTVDEDTPF